MQVTVNGKSHELESGQTLAQLLIALDTPRQGIAVEVNTAIVRRADHAARTLIEGDQIEIVGLVGGG